MPDRDIAFIRDAIYYQYAKIIPKSTFAGAGGESRLKHRGDKKFYGSIPPHPEKTYLKTIYNCHNCSGRLDNGDSHKPRVFVGREWIETQNIGGLPLCLPARHISTNERRPVSIGCTPDEQYPRRVQ